MKTSIPLISLQRGIEWPDKIQFPCYYNAKDDFSEDSLWLCNTVWSWFSDSIYFVTIVTSEKKGKVVEVFLENLIATFLI